MVTKAEAMKAWEDVNNIIDRARFWMKKLIFQKQLWRPCQKLLMDKFCLFNKNENCRPECPLYGLYCIYGVKIHGLHT